MTTVELIEDMFATLSSKWARVSATKVESFRNIPDEDYSALTEDYQRKHNRIVLNLNARVLNQDI